MILTTRFVFLHIPRTGGTFVRKLFLEAAPDDWRAEIREGHPSAREIPEGMRHLPRIAVVRNPFDWYVSWYHFMVQIGGNPLYAAASAQGRRGFSDTIRAFLELPVGDFFSLPAGHSEPMPAISLSWYLGYLLDGRGDGVDMVRFESLRTELVRAFSAATPLPEQFRRCLEEAAPANVSERGDYRAYYDPDLRRRVETADAPILERFGYSF